jgi:outer membrane protein assembly factor BamB
VVLLAVTSLAVVACLQVAMGQGGKGKGEAALPALPPGTTGAPAPRPPADFSDNISLPEKVEYKDKIIAITDYVQEAEQAKARGDLDGEKEAWSKATGQLQFLIQIPQDVFVPLDRKGPDNTTTRVWTSVRTEAERLISGLPKEGRDFYKTRYGEEAAEILQKARQSSSYDLLADAARRFLYTDAGGEAATLVAGFHLERGNYVLASLCYSDLLDRDGVDKLPKNVLVRAAIAFHLGQDITSKEDQVWKELLTRGASVQLGETNWNVRDLQNYVASLTRKSDDNQRYTNPFFGGAPNRNAKADGGPPFMEASWRQSTSRTEDSSAYLKQAATLLANRNPAMLPAFFPVSATVTIKEQKVSVLIWRSFWGLHAHDMKTGRRLWEASSAWSIDRMVRDVKKVEAIKQWMGYYLTQNTRPSLLFENSTVGCLSTDNTFVYAVEDLAVPPPPNANFQGNPRRPIPPPVPGGNFNPDVSEAVQHSRLQAYDLVTGKLKWEVGGVGDKQELSDSYFLGPPLPLAGKLYVLTEKNQDLRLAVLEASSGKLLGIQTLASTKDKIQADVLRRTYAAHLSYGDGMLICPTNAGALLCVNLLKNSLVWAYPYREGDSGAAGVPMGPGGPGKGRPNPGFNPIPPLNPAGTEWKVTAPIVSEGKVIFTAPDAKSVHCVNLRDGSRIWSQPKNEEDLYLGGVYNGKVLIIGRRATRALALNDGGRVLWNIETGLPSGMGVCAENVYYLPLREAAASKEPEIVALDIDRGAIHAHTKSRKKDVPGNLLFCEGSVLSQGLNEVLAYPQLKVKLAEIDARLAIDQDDAVGRLERGDLRLDQGDLQGAVDDLATALRSGKLPEPMQPKAKEKLYETLTEYLQRDFNTAEKYLPDYENLCKIDLTGAITDQEKADRQAEGRKRKANYLYLVGKGKQEQGKLVEALEKYQEFGGLGSGHELLSVVDEPTVRVAPDVWAQGRIAAMVGKATAEERKPLEDHIQQQWAQVKKADDPDRLRKFVAVYGSLFTVGKEARLQLAEALMKENEPQLAPQYLLDAERHLNLLRSAARPTDADRQLAGRAVEALARLNTKKGLLEDAAYYYDLLQRDFGDVVIKDGMTGADIFDELVTDKRFLPLLDKPAKVSSGGKVKVEDVRNNSSVSSQTYYFGLAGEELPFFKKNVLALHMGQHELKVIDRATDTERWAVKLTKTQFQMLVNSQNGRPNAPRFKFQSVGHLVVLPLGHMVFALDPVNQKVLWEKNLLAPLASSAATTAPSSAPQQMQTDPVDGSIQIYYPDGWWQRLGQTGTLQGTAIVLQTKDGLLAVDPVTGDTLWMRSDVKSSCHLFTDDQHIFIVETNEANKATSTRVFRLYDGVSVDKVPDFAAVYNDRNRLVGRNILTEKNDEKGVIVRLYDALTGKDAWSTTYAVGSQVLQSEQTALLGVVEPDGKLHVIDLQTVKPMFTARIDPRHLQGLQGRPVLLRDAQNCYVICNTPVNQNIQQFGGVQLNLQPGSGMRALPVNGTIFAFDLGTGKTRWYNKVESQQLVLDLFEEMPVLLFTSRYQTWTQNGPARNVIQIVTAKSISKQTGKLLYDNNSDPNDKTRDAKYPPLVQQWMFHELSVKDSGTRFEFKSQGMVLSHVVE